MRARLTKGGQTKGWALGSCVSSTTCSINLIHPYTIIGSTLFWDAVTIALQMTFSRSSLIISALYKSRWHWIFGQVLIFSNKFHWLLNTLFLFYTILSILAMNFHEFWWSLTIFNVILGSSVSTATGTTEERRCKYQRANKLLKIRCHDMHLKEVPSHLKTSIEVRGTPEEGGDDKGGGWLTV